MNTDAKNNSKLFNILLCCEVVFQFSRDDKMMRFRQRSFVIGGN